MDPVAFRPQMTLQPVGAGRAGGERRKADQNILAQHKRIATLNEGPRIIEEIIFRLACQDRCRIWHAHVSGAQILSLRRIAKKLFVGEVFLAAGTSMRIIRLDDMLAD